jgi:hypothetical protein
MLSLTGNPYQLDWDVHRGIDLIPCRHGEIGVWSGIAYYARTGDEEVRAALLAIGGVRKRGDALVFVPELLDAIAEVMGAKRLM